MIPFDIKDACLWANTTILTKLIHRVRGPPCGDGAQHRPGAFPGPAAAVRGPPRGFWRALAFSRRSDNESRCNRGLTARSLAKCTPGPRLPWPPPKARASRGAERAHAQRHPQGIRANQIPERMASGCYGMEKSGQKCGRDCIFNWGIKRKFETPAMANPLVARGSMAQARFYHGRSGLLINYSSIIKDGKPYRPPHRHSPHCKT